MTTFKNIKETDYQNSSKWEKILKKDIETYFNTNLIETNRYDIFDYISEDNNIYIELKTRTCKSDTYPDLMMGNNKIKFADELLKDDKLIYFVFKFTDGLYYLQYDSVDDYTMRGGGRKDRGVNEWKKNYVYFPIKKLIKIN